jgi:hypothetical protein
MGVHFKNTNGGGEPFIQTDGKINPLSTYLKQGIPYELASMLAEPERELFRSSDSSGVAGFSHFPHLPNSQYAIGDIVSDWWGLGVKNWNAIQHGNKVYNTGAVTYTSDSYTGTGDGAGNVDITVTDNFANDLVVGMVLLINDATPWVATGIDGGGNGKFAVVQSITDSNNFRVKINGVVSAATAGTSAVGVLSTSYQNPEFFESTLEYDGTDPDYKYGMQKELWIKAPSTMDDWGQKGSYYDGQGLETSGGDSNIVGSAWYRNAQQAIAGNTKFGETIFNNVYGGQGFVLQSLIKNETGNTWAGTTGNTPEAKITSSTNHGIDGGSSPELYLSTRSNVAGNGHGGGFNMNDLQMRPSGFLSGFTRKHANTGGNTSFVAGQYDEVGSGSVPSARFNYTHNNGTSGGANAEWESFLQMNRGGTRNVDLSYRNNLTENGGGRWNDKQMYMDDTSWKFNLWGNGHNSTEFILDSSTDTNRTATGILSPEQTNLITTGSSSRLGELRVNAQGDVSLKRNGIGGKTRYIIMNESLLTWHYNIDTVFGNKFASMNINDTGVYLNRDNVGSGLATTYGFQITDSGVGFVAGTGATLKPAFYTTAIAAGSFTNDAEIPNKGYVDIKVDIKAGVITTKSANYTAVAGDSVIMTTGATDKTTNLPASPVVNDMVELYKEDSGVGNAILNGNGKNVQLLGSVAATQTITAQGESFTAYYTGVKWIIK